MGQLVTGEIALAVVLLIGAGLLIRTLLALRAVNPGFDSHNVLTMQMSVSEMRFMKGTAMDQFIRESIRHVDALPGVESSALSCCLPLETVWQLPLMIQGRPLNGRFHAFAGWTFVSPDYFETLQHPAAARPHVHRKRRRQRSRRGDHQRNPGPAVVAQWRPAR